MVENINERAQWQMLLEKVERDLAEHEKKGLALKTTRNYLRSLLKLSVEEETELPVSTVEAHVGVLPKFKKGDFYGFSQAKAAYGVLEKAGGSLTTDEILSVLADSGYDVGGQDPKKTLYSSLIRSRKLVKVAEHTFDLAERRPKPRRTKEEKKAQLEQQAQAVPKSREEKESD